MADSKRILLFNVNADKATLIKNLCSGMGIRPVTIYKNQYGERIGVLAGIKGISPSGEIYRGEDFTSEMMVFCGLNSDELDEFLQNYRDAKIPPIGLKATVTPHNISWSAAKLYEELTQEHKFFQNK